MTKIKRNGGSLHRFTWGLHLGAVVGAFLYIGFTLGWREVYTAAVRRSSGATAWQESRLRVDFFVVMVD